MISESVGWWYCEDKLDILRYEIWVISVSGGTGELSNPSSVATRWQLEQAEGGHKNTPAVKIVLKLRKRSPLMLDLTWNLWTSLKPPRLRWFPQFWHHDTVRPLSRWPDSVPRPEIRPGCSPGREIHTMHLPRFHRNDWILCPPAFLFLGLLFLLMTLPLLT